MDTPKEIIRARAQGRHTAMVGSIEGLNIEARPKQRLGNGQMSFTGETITVNPQTPILVRQSRIQLKALDRYLSAVEEDNEVEPILLHRDAEGNLWHLNGLHRLVSHRIMDKSLKATLWE